MTVFFVSPVYCKHGPEEQNNYIELFSFQGF